MDKITRKSVKFPKYMMLNDEKKGLNSTTTNRYQFLMGILMGTVCTMFLIFNMNYNDVRATTPTGYATGSQDNQDAVTTVETEQHHRNSNDHTTDDGTVANELFDKVKILCWIMTNPSNHKEKAIHINNTWAQRCNKVLYMSTEEDDVLETIALPVEEGREHLWSKTKEAFKYIHAHFLDDYDWFLKADDDTYVVMENLRYFLYPYSAEFPIYFGCKFKPYVPGGYMSGGAGYVLSRESVIRLVEKAFIDENRCLNVGIYEEDIALGICLKSVNVTAGDSRDAEGRGKFFPFPPDAHIQSITTYRDDFWYFNYTFYHYKVGFECCSDYAISFHYIKPNEMYVFEYLIYYLRPFGIAFKHDALLPKKLSKEEYYDKQKISINDKNFTLTNFLDVN